MPVTPQNMAALKRAQEVRLEAVRQRRELRGKSVGVIVPALIHPTPELATLQLRLLFTSAKGSLIARFGPHALNQALNCLGDFRCGRQSWHDRLRLDELTEPERRRLAREVVKQAPSNWREAA